MTVSGERQQQFVGPVRALGLGAPVTDPDVDTTLARAGDVLRLDLRQDDGTIMRVLGIVRSIQDADPDPGRSAVLEYVHPGSELELVDWVRTWEASALEQVDALVMLFNQDGELSWVNTAVERTLHWRPDELLGCSFDELQRRLGLQLDRHDIAASVMRSGSWSASVQLQTRAGQHRLLHVRVTAVRDPDGAVRGMTAIVRDETELQRLRSVAEAVNLATNVGQMFAGIRHELGNPINSLKIALTVLRNSWLKFERPRVEHYLEQMLVEIGRVEHLLRSLRTFSAFEDVQSRPCSTRAVLSSLAPMVESAARERGIRQHIDLGDDLWVMADCRALYQALLNLVTNALDATLPAEGRVELRAFRCGPGAIALEVSDNGDGIPTEDLDEVLRPFITTKPHGNGLGLPIVQRLAMAMGGELVLDSEPGRGTRARIVLVEVLRDA